jgi:virginiamycin B lyase
MQFPVPTPGGYPLDITAGPDGNLWFTEYLGNNIGRITPAGAISEFSVPTPGTDPTYITTGPDGNVWFTEDHGNNIGRITPAGVITEFSTPTPSRGGGITTGPDGNLWFLESNANKIVKATLGAQAITPEGNSALLLFAGLGAFGLPTALRRLRPRSSH